MKRNINEQVLYKEEHSVADDRKAALDAALKKIEKSLVKAR